WFSRWMSLNCEIVLVLKRAEFDVEPLLEPFTRNCARNSCGRVRRNDWHDPAKRRSDPEHTDVAFHSMDARCNCRVALIFLVVCHRTWLATQHAGNAKTRSACTVAVKARMDMGAHCRIIGNYRHDRDGIRDGACGTFAAGGICRTSRFLKVRDSDNHLRDCLY